MLSLLPNAAESSENMGLEPILSLESALGLGNEIRCRGLFGEGLPKNQRSVVIGHPAQPGKYTTNLADFYDVCGGTDVYFSPNEFFSWRRRNQVASLHANYLDIDIRNKAKLSDAAATIVLNDVLHAINQSGVPAPTGYVQTGSGGLHIYWVYAPVEAYKWRVRLWRSLTKTLTSRIKSGNNWFIDSHASSNVAGVLRLPGAFHGKTGKMSTSHLVGKGNIYTFDELSLSLGHDPHQRVLPFKPNDKIKTKRRYNSSNNLGQWWGQIYLHVVSNIRKYGVEIGGRSRGKDRKLGNRDMFAFILYTALQHIHRDKNEAWNAIVTLNDELIGLSEHELEGYLETAREIGYKYSTESLFEFFSQEAFENQHINPAFVYELKKQRVFLAPEEVLKRQSESARATNDKRVNNTLSKLNTALVQAREQSLPLTQATLAQLSGKSRSTVQRYWTSLDHVNNDACIKRYRSKYPRKRDVLFDLEEKEDVMGFEQVIEQFTFDSKRGDVKINNALCKNDVIDEQIEVIGIPDDDFMVENVKQSDLTDSSMNSVQIIEGEEQQKSESPPDYFTQMRRILAGETLPDP